MQFTYHSSKQQHSLTAFQWSDAPGNL